MPLKNLKVIELAGLGLIPLCGILSLCGWLSRIPSPPVNFCDFAGGSLMCFTGILLALLNRTKTGKGQVIDASVVEGTAYIGSWLMQAQKQMLQKPRGQNWLDGGAAFYDIYETKDEKFMAVGCIELKFFDELVSKLNLSADQLSQIGLNNQEKTRKIFEDKFKTKSQKEWCEIFDESDTCVTPVLSIEEAANHRHNID